MSLVVPFEEIFANETGILAKHDSWERVELGKVCTILNGFPFKSSLFNRSEGFPVIRIRDIANSATETFYNGDFPPEYVVKKGDLLIGMDGNFRCCEWRGSDAALNQRVCKITPDEEILHRRFLLYGLNGYLKTIEDVTSSVTVGHLSSRDVQRIPFPLPPLGEQRRVVAKLKKLLGKVDACQQRLAKIPVLLKRFRQSVLAAACAGRLTAGWREEHDNGESSVQLLRSFDAKPLAEGGDDVPETWSWGKFGELVTNHDGQRIPVKQSDRDKRSGPYPYYGAFGVIDDIDEYLYDGDYLLLAEDGKNLESRLRPISLIASGKFWVNNHAHVLQAKGGIPLRFLNAWLNSPTLDLSPFLTGIDQVKLNRAAMDRIPVPIAPFPEQQEIVRRVEALFALADQIEARYAKAKAYVEKLTPSLLARAFRGELVPQDPNDEPASVLLERIKQQRNGTKENNHYGKAKTKRTNSSRNRRSASR